jgi:hypothetical protein
VSSIQDGKLLAKGEVLECQFRAESQGGRDQTEQAENHQDHGQEVSGPEAHKVNRFSAAGVLANDRPVVIRHPTPDPVFLEGWPYSLNALEVWSKVNTGTVQRYH